MEFQVLSNLRKKQEQLKFRRSNIQWVSQAKEIPENKKQHVTIQAIEIHPILQDSKTNYIDLSNIF